MTALRSRARTAESYLAELGVVGTLLAGGLVVFLLIVGLVTFDAWPNPGGLFSSDDSTVEAGSSEDATPASTRVPALPARGSVVKGGVAGRKGAGDGGNGSADVTGGDDLTGGGSTSGGASETGGGSSQTGGGSGSVGQAVSGASDQVGGAVNGATGTNAGDAVSGAGNTAGNAVSGLGL